MVNELSKITNIEFKITNITSALQYWDRFGVAEDDFEIDINLYLHDNKVHKIKTDLDVYQLIDFVGNLIKNFKNNQFDKIETCYFIDIFIHGNWIDENIILIDFENHIKGAVPFIVFTDSVKDVMNDLIKKVDKIDPTDKHNKKDDFLKYWHSTLKKVEEWKAKP